MILSAFWRIIDKKVTDPGTFREGVRDSTSELALKSRLSTILFSIGLELKISIGSLRAGQVVLAKSRLNSG